MPSATITRRYGSEAARRRRRRTNAVLRGAVLASLFLFAPTLQSSAQKPPPLGAPDTGPRGGGGGGGGRSDDFGGDPGGKPGKPPPLGAPDGPRGGGGGGGGSGGGGGRFRLPFFGGGGDLPGENERPDSSGTGFAVAPGRLLTNNHVVNECGRMVARNTRGQRIAARVDTTDPRRDLALLTVEAGFAPPLTFRADPPIRRGETVVTYGFPLSGLLSSGPTLTTGDVSALAGLRNNPANLQISAPVQPGNSGGPLLDLQANVVGVVVSKLNAARIAQMTGGDIPQNVNFAVKGSEALAFLRANGVQPRTASSNGTDKRGYEVGEIADPSTVFLQCYR